MQPTGKCPELNPQNNVWPFVRDNSLYNHVFDNDNALIDHCAVPRTNGGSTLDHHVYRNARFGASILVRDLWYTWGSSRSMTSASAQTYAPGACASERARLGIHQLVHQIADTETTMSPSGEGLPVNIMRRISS